MTDRRVFVVSDNSIRYRAMEYLKTCDLGTALLFKKKDRSLEQNAAQWPYLDAFSKQLQWPVNGTLCWMSQDEWKDVLTAAFYGENVRLAQGLDGKVVMLGKRTSKFSKQVFSEWLEFLKATAALRGVTVYEDNPT